MEELIEDNGEGETAPRGGPRRCKEIKLKDGAYLLLFFFLACTMLHGIKLDCEWERNVCKF